MALLLNQVQLQFLRDHHQAAMVTLRADTTPHVAQVGVGIVQGPDGTDRLWSSGMQGRQRTRHLRRDPRCTLCLDPLRRWLAWRRRS